MIQDTAPTTPKSAKSSSSSLATTPKKQQQQEKFNFTNNNDRNNNDSNKWSPPSAPATSKQQSPPQTNGVGHYDASNNRFELEPEAENFIQQMVEQEVEAGPPSPAHEQQHEEPSVPVESQKYNLEEGLGKAKYTFRAESETELSFKKVSYVSFFKVCIMRNMRL